MKSVGLLSSNLPIVIDRSYLSPSREAMTQGTRKQTTEPILGTLILGMGILGTNKIQPLLH